MSTAQTLVARWGRSNDAALHARQFLERRLGADPERVFTASDYRYAADCLYGVGNGPHGEVLDAIAAADHELQTVSQTWVHRYDNRPLTAWERAAQEALHSGQVVEHSRAGHGIDGAWYAPASIRRGERPAVVVRTSAGTRFVVPFANTSEMTSWLMNRAPEATGPLQTSRNGPVTRSGREEELLACAIRNPQEAPRLLSRVGPETMTADLRAELAIAVKWATETGGTPEYSVIGEAYARRLLRAPGTAAEEIEWPAMRRAMTYLRRLAETPVTPKQASEAAIWLARADTEAARIAAGRSNAPAHGTTAVPAQTARTSPSLAPTSAVQQRALAAQPVQATPEVPGPRGPIQQM
jgi:hypothetical protein